MVYFPESVIITTKDGIQFKTFSNQHPEGFIIAKPKYIPIKHIFCEKLQLRNLFDVQVNRLNMWIDKIELSYYLKEFKKVYPHYHYESDFHKNWFFAIPKNAIKQIFDPKEGLKVLTELPEEKCDEHLKTTIGFVKFLLKSGIDKKDLGITFSTLVGHYDSDYSDINVVIYGKENAWNVLKFLEKAEHPSLRWKNPGEWLIFRKKRNRRNIFTEGEFIEQFSRKKTEGFFEGKLFVLFPVEKEQETWYKWGNEKHAPIGHIEVEAIVIGQCMPPVTRRLINPDMNNRNKTTTQNPPIFFMLLLIFPSNRLHMSSTRQLSLILVRYFLFIDFF